MWPKGSPHIEQSNMLSGNQIPYDSSRIILLFDPEHITAANFRKRRIINLRQTSSARLPEAYAQEIHFLNSILTSPLHRQSKSPTLWFHRWWLVDQLLAQTEDYE